MNILIVSQYFAPEVGATQNRMASFAKAMVLAGHSVTVVTEAPNHPQGIIRPEYRDRWLTRETLDGYTVVRTFVITSPRKTFLRRIAFYLSFMVGSIIAGWRVKGKTDYVLATSPPIFVGAAGWAIARHGGTRPRWKRSWPACCGVMRSIAVGSTRRSAWLTMRWSLIPPT